MVSTISNPYSDQAQPEIDRRFTDMVAANPEAFRIPDELRSGLEDELWRADPADAEIDLDDGAQLFTGWENTALHGDAVEAARATIEYKGANMPFTFEQIRAYTPALTAWRADCINKSQSNPALTDTLRSKG